IHVIRHDMYECAGRRINPFWGVKHISKYWEHATTINDAFWQAPKDLFWICGNTAYTNLPKDWSGSCTVGIIKPSFFLLPKESGQNLGVPI
ncbi:ENR1 protein, partial [Chaetops frenatus]|nr:ENR1 protein [Chaetops frenatus]